MALHLHRATRADRLAAGLGELLDRALPTDPFATEIVAVPTPGVERWLAQQLAAHLGRTPPRAESTETQQRNASDVDSSAADGICAGIDFCSPERLIGQALATVTDIDPHADPWQPHRAVWPLVTVIDAVREEEWAKPLWRFLAARQHRFSTAGHLSELFSNYAANRPQMIMHWAGGADTDGNGEGLPEGTEWQPRLWRMLREQIDTPSPAERLADGCHALRSDPGRTDLPARLSIFGPTRLGYATLAVLAALAHNRDVHLWLPHASPALWSKIATPGDPTAISPPALGSTQNAGAVGPSILPKPPGRRADDPSAASGSNRLLSYLGRDARELQLCLAGVPATVCDHPLDPPSQAQQPTGQDHDTTGHDPNQPLTQSTAADQHSGTCDQQFVDHGDATSQLRDEPDLLSRLQSDLSRDRPLSGTTELSRLDPDDASIQVHASHGPDRQVEVLREVILGLLADDPTLQPRDIVVMCPDVETFAPLIAATFGAGYDGTDDPLDSPADSDGNHDGDIDSTPGSHPGHRIRVRLADRSLRQVNPLLQTLSRLFEMADSRMEASTVLDLCAFEPVATKFGFTADDVLRLRDLVLRSGVRWGMGGADRSRFGLSGYTQNTWGAGLDRLLLGVAMDESGEEYLGTTLPMDDVDAGDVDLVGRLAEAVQRIRTVIEQLSLRQSLQDWVDACRSALDLLTAVRGPKRWQVGQAYSELARLAETADSATALLSRTEAAAVLSDILTGRPSRASFRTGTLTVATLQPMRSVPHRVICLLGMDDGAFPRTGAVDGDDVLATDPWIGDQDRRSEDRQLLLDAIMATTDKLVALYAGADARTNAPRPPSVPLGELLDACDQTVQTADGQSARRQIMRHHPLQPFDGANFHGGSNRDPQVDGGDVPFSFDPDALAGAKAAAHPRQGWEPTYTSDPLPPFDLPAVIQLSDLIRFFDHPPRAFLRVRAGLSSFDDEEPDADQMPVSLDGLQQWEIGDRMLRLHLDGVEMSQVIGAEWRRGSLPPRELGRRVMEPIVERVTGLAERGRTLRTRTARSVDVAAPVPATKPAAAAARSGASSDMDGASANTGSGFESRVDHGDGEKVDDTPLVVVGTVPDVFDEHQVTVHYSRLAAKHRLRSWIQLVALTATDPQPWQVTAIGRGRRNQPAISTLGPIEPQIARLVLADLVDLYRTGLTQALPLPPKTGAEYAHLRGKGHAPDVIRPAVAKLWDQDRDKDYEAFFGSGAEYDRLTSESSIPHEERGGLAEPSRFGSLARRVWHPLLQAERWG